ncbi:hypothetical protein J1605_018696 [Eschrichtius robustus]|uniref:SWIM-type domain-containing protein n=1 Tax=Eschrichtius robustus TaxID=9764 RepID=A0AB34HXE8_ESCRO|nr:hypothetical protein J1605_018696 [Eschrichtius robustus]
MEHFSTSWSSQLLCTQTVGLDPYPLCPAAFSAILAVRLGRRLFNLPDILITYSLTTPPCQCVFNLIDLKCSHQAIWRLFIFVFKLKSANPKSEEVYQRQVLSISCIIFGIVIVGMFCAAFYFKSKKQAKQIQEQLKEPHNGKNYSLKASSTMAKSENLVKNHVQLQKVLLLAARKKANTPETSVTPKILLRESF